MENYKIDYIGDIKNINIYDDNIDIYVSFANGKKYFSTFFTLRNIERLILEYKKSGECCSGKYFWAVDMCIVEEISEQVVADCISCMLKNGEFEKVFSPVPVME